jgi:hypothetical protein
MRESEGAEIYGRPRFYPGSRRLHIVHGQPSSGNDDCSPEEELLAGVPTTVRIEMRQAYMEVLYGVNGRPPTVRCTEPRTEGPTSAWRSRRGLYRTSKSLCDRVVSGLTLRNYR